jgi:hypothetical protein
MLDEGAKKSGLPQNTKSTKAANLLTAKDAILAFTKSNVPARSEKAIKDSERRGKLHKQSEAAEKALHIAQGAGCNHEGHGL